MAKNWTLKEAVQVITEGTNKAAIQELGKKFPITVVAIAKMGANEGIQTIFGAMPEHMTMLKMERTLKEGVEDVEEDTTAETEDGDASEAADADLSNMTTKQLYNLCVKRGIKANKYGKPKSYYIELLEGGSDQAEDEAEDEEEEKSKYSEMSAVELYKLCKKRGVKVEPKQKTAVYIAALEEVDAAAEPEEEDDWDEEEKEAKSTKPAKANAKASGKAKKAPVDDDDDDDWDI